MPTRPLDDERVCATCGRRFEWRPRWAGVWDEIRHCSKRCRRNRPDDTDRALEGAVIDLLAERAGGASICPSEAARAVAPDDWRRLMPRARRAAARLVAAGRVEITQRGRVVDPASARGPIRVRRGPRLGAR